MVILCVPGEIWIVGKEEVVKTIVLTVRSLFSYHRYLPTTNATMLLSLSLSLSRFHTHCMKYIVCNKKTSGGGDKYWP